MTVSYNYDVCSASVTGFIRLLFRWKGSIWKCVFKELFIWTILYSMVSFMYRTPYILTESQKVTFEDTANYLEKYLKKINITFILGFFVSTVATRWTSILQNMGFIESNALFISSYINGDDDETRMIRRAILRYLCLSQILVYRDISLSVRKRFPTMDSLIKAGYLLEHERAKMEDYNLAFNKYWVPINWAATLVFTARKSGRITGDILVNKLMDEIKVFRNNLQMLCNYDWVPIPLVYPQVILIAVYFYFAVCLVTRQFIMTTRNIPIKSNIDLFVPVVTMIQFIFFVGWMKVAMALLNPLGEDDDDFECNYLANKNLTTSLLIVDKCCGDAPPVKEDQFYESGVVEPLYPESSVTEDHPLIGSAAMAK
ncbi:unnamed protein product [Enterobius vermicularis]|uniref:Bestrophin homolog n=1 Tax=Enterobius vermicularis TaxID=51028 RepID=A0A0N4UZ49_ENTVE|nr:unnamed protein product [Enterobius vermicularis]